MNTSNKGLAFEKKVYEYILDLLNKGKLFVAKKNSHIYHRKRYYSSDRQSNIITDISIETFNYNSEKYSLLTVIECKDYARPVPVSDLEEFYSKIKQISGVNVKAILATTSALQSSALYFAEKNGIAVVRFMPARQIQWIYYRARPLHLSDSRYIDIDFSSALLSQNHISANRDLYITYKRKKYNRLQDLILAIHKSRK